MLQDADMQSDPAPTAGAHGGRPAAPRCKVDEDELHRSLMAELFAPQPKHGGDHTAGSTHGLNHMVHVLQMREASKRDPDVFMPMRSVRALVVAIVLSEVQATALSYRKGETPDADLRSAGYWLRDLTDGSLPLTELIDRLDHYARELAAGGTTVQRIGH
jgi:hypothetical protein